MKSTAEQRGWYWYDWANSAFYTTVITVLLGPYLTDLTTNAADANGLVHPFGITVYAKSYWSYLISLSVGMQVLFLPVVGAIADYGRRKKEVLGATAYVGALASCASRADSRRRCSLECRCWRRSKHSSARSAPPTRSSVDM